jgi:hypothetical protein
MGRSEKGGLFSHSKAFNRKGREGRKRKIRFDSRSGFGVAADKGDQVG